jgi:hypothetical protein
MTDRNISLPLPVGNSMASLTKVAMADQMGRGLAKEAASKILLSKADKAIEATKKLISGVTGKGKKKLLTARLKTLEGLAKGQRSARARGVTGPSMTKSVSQRTGKAKHKFIEAKTTSSGKRAHKALAKEYHTPGAVAKQNRGVLPGGVAKKGRSTDWKDLYKNKDVQIGAAVGLGAGLVGSALLGS